MIDIIFVCVMGATTKQIKEGMVDTRIGKECRVMIDEKTVGHAKHNPNFCKGLAFKIKKDMEKKGYVCKESTSDKK